MLEKKIKVFLGGYTNYVNAQNLNCRALAEHLDKRKFGVYTLALYNGQLSDMPSTAGLKVFKCFRPVRLSQYLGFLWGIWHCDVAYLPKDDLWKFNRFLLRLLKKKSFSTIEVILEPVIYHTLLAKHVNREMFLQSKRYFSRLFSITHYMSRFNYDVCGLKTENEVLFLGVNAKLSPKTTMVPKLEKVIMIGNDLVRKGISDYLELSKSFPDLTFVVVGSGNGQIDIDQEIQKNGIRNVIYKGMLGSAALSDLLQTVDLHILPSRSEGFPKVVLETASAGIPSVLYADYGADEWVENNKNGWIVNTIAEMADRIRKLQNEPAMLSAASRSAVELAKTFDWKIKILQWERVIMDIHE
ncbi:glycosyltransferase family 4 protein [Pedobacter sp. MC2016-14]|uniref:glycosyltransferase family 4 protein n=1 Tax=Pedobacter sp. MC2016-14 TaxID=2897327 RepID=UPI001E6145AE|nr:glycosyltransferase family 4 protein [Pedobacter sp. MC2016-14]MCD0486906.1 glycosyltransferase family 4 protein [Pedobacter sp. MC2016-14]